MSAALRQRLAWLPQGIALGLLAFAIFGPLLNLLLWAVAEQWYFPHKLPLDYGFRSGSGCSGRAATRWSRSATASRSRCARWPRASRSRSRGLRARPPRAAAARLILLAFLLPQAFPSLAVYINVARIFYGLGLNGTIMGVVLVHTMHGLVFAVWIATAAFAAVDRELEEAARNLGVALQAFRAVTLPLAAPGIMASAIFVFLESLDEFTGTYFVGVPDVTTLPLLLFTASMEGNYQIASITALILLVPSVGFMLLIERFLKADVLAKVGS